MALHDPRPRPLDFDPDDAAEVAPLAPLPTYANGTLYGLFAVGGMLGHRKRTEAWLCRMIDALIAHDGFPQPLPLPTRAGHTSRAAHRDSRWPAAAVDAWLAAQVPAGLVAAVDTTALTAASARLDARARALTVIDGGRA